MNIVHLENAWSWKCPGCGHRNFHLGSPVTDPELLADATEAFSEQENAGEDWKPKTGEMKLDLVCQPEQVQCATCRTTYDVEIIA